MAETLYGLTPESARDFREMQRQHHATRERAPGFGPAQPIEYKSSGTGSFWARVTASSQDGTNKRWTYTVAAVEKSGATWSGWADGTSYTAYNTIEAMNGATGTFGNGVASTNLVGTFTVKPAPNGAIVRVWPTVRTDNGAVEYWFEYGNAIDGQCP